LGKGLKDKGEKGKGKCERDGEKVSILEGHGCGGNRDRIGIKKVTTLGVIDITLKVLLIFYTTKRKSTLLRAAITANL